MDDLFTAAASERLAARGPLADRLRPLSLDDVVGQDHLLGADKPLRALVATDRLSSVILWGPPGTGKTTLARLLAHASSKAFEALSAVTASVAYGHTVGKILAFAYLKPDAAQPGTALEVVIHGAPRAARVLAEPAYDPDSVLPRTDALQEAAE